ncbi:5,10-methylene tetrahydromethanopterin reductase, partial [Streptomyces sp. YS415]|nr:5,10-methylene tetrahydromethanopterin reductase [Streptomyces sp. YS415]
VDPGGMPEKTVLEQLDLFGEILPVLRKEFAAGRPAQVPDGPLHPAQRPALLQGATS